MIKHLKIFFVFCVSLFLTGCSTLSYIGDDYDTNNIATVKTNEDFVFNTYKKTMDNANFRLGISKTPIPEILALYVQIDNLSQETPYVFKVDNLRVYDREKELKFISSNNYLDIYQNQEVSSMASMSTLGSTLSTMTGMIANYNNFNQQMVQNSAQASNESAMSRLDDIGSRILSHSIKFSSTITPRKSQYYYFFFENSENFPIRVNYLDLNYQFTL